MGSPAIDYLGADPPLYPAQRAAIFADERYSLIEASTKSGKTVGCLVWIMEQAMAGRRGWNYWWVAPVYAQAKVAYRRLKNMLEPWVYRSNETELTLALPNGAVIWFKTGEKPDNLYGEDVYACVLDEATRMREEAWHAVRTTLSATGGPIRIIGNVKGRRNWVWKMARRAEQGAKDMHYAKLTWRDAVAAGLLKEAEVLDARDQLPLHVWRELYEAEASDDASNPFGLAYIAACIRATLSPSQPVAWGWDLAKSVDWTVGIGLDPLGDVCRYERFQRPWEETVDRILKATGKVVALVDSTGVGDPILERLRKDGGANYTGYKFSQPSKQQLMEGLAVAIQGGDIGYPDGPVVQELEIFEYEYTRTGVRYSAPEGFHDDCVMALGLAWACFRGRKTIQIFV
jgi:hypothetical protein